MGFKQVPPWALCFALANLGPSLTACGENPFLERVAELRGPREGAASWPLPDPTFLTLSGDSVPLRSLLGERLTLVNFGGTWCPPCEKELPELQALHERWSGRGVSIVVAAISSKQEDLESWVERYQLTFPVLHGLTSPEWENLRSDLDARGVPMSLIVDGAGTVRYFFRGYRDRAAAEALLAPFLIEAGVVAPEDDGRGRVPRRITAGRDSRLVAIRVPSYLSVAQLSRSSE